MSTGSGLRLRNDATPRGKGWWSWSVWLEGPEAELDSVESVRYVLHPTFPDPVQIVTDRASRFKLSTSGWGEFSIVAQVTTKDGQEFNLERWIILGESAPSKELVDQRRPAVFLSYSATDRPLVSALRKALKEQGVEVIAPEDLIPGSSWSEEVAEGVARAQVAAFLVSGELRGFAEEELALARRYDREIVPILVGKSEHIPSLLKEYEAIRLDSPDQAGAVADRLAARAKDAFYQE